MLCKSNSKKILPERWGRGVALLLAAALAPALLAQNAAQARTLIGLGVQWKANATVAAGPNGQPATTVPLDKPAAVAYDAAGNFYIADQNNNLIRRVDTAGLLTNYAGTGDQDFSGDGGQATQASLNHPLGVAVDTAGNLYISDTGNQRIRRVTPAGVITTVAGTGTAGFSGDGGLATQAALSRPAALVVDATGNLFFADSNNHRIREMVQATGNIVTVAGSGDQGFGGDGASALNAQLDTPEGIAVDSTGRIYLADAHNNRIRRVSSGIISTIAGNGTATIAGDNGAATAASFATPRGVSLLGDGTLLIADSNNQRIRRIAADGTVATIAGSGVQGQDASNGSATAVSLDTPRSVTAGPNNAVTIADTNNDLVRNVATNASIVTTAGVGTQPSSAATLSISSQTLVYGQGTASVTVTAGSGQAGGSVTFYDFGSPIGTAQLSSNTATIALVGLLKAGAHSLSASYAGDTNTPPATTAVVAVTVTPLALTPAITAPTLQYGQAIPALTATLSGALPQDAPNLSLTLSTTATSTSSPGTYTITGVLSGSAAPNYSLTQPVGNLLITKANATIALTVSANGTVLNAPTTLTANVASTTSGTPTGSVTFFDGATAIGTAQPMSNGQAQLTVTTFTAGPHTITASYGGDVNFNGIVSSSVVTQVGDFTFALAPGTVAAQTVIPGRTATFNLTATAAGSFPYPVTLTATGLPPGATATFSPATLSLSSGSASFTLTVQTSATAAADRRMLESVQKGAPLLALLLLPAASGLRRRPRWMRSLLLIAVSVVSLGALLGLSGCGSSSGFFGKPQGTYTINVIGTASNGQGGTLQRTTTVTLTVQ